MFVDVSATKYHSRFGGLWIDRKDWRETLSAKRLPDHLQLLIEQFVEDGFIILPGAADLATVDAFQSRIEQGFRKGNPALFYQNHGSGETHSLDKPVDRLGTRVVDSFAALKEALDLFTSPRLLEFLNAIFAEDPLLFQSLSFDQGSQQGLHQDTAYVVVDKPLQLAACWIALEDVKPGSGELIYAPGSHRLPDWVFGGGRKHWDVEADGHAPHDEFSARLRTFAAESPKGLSRFFAKKGDILVWHADLAHGGVEIEDRSFTRQSLVGHFCPQSARPRYFDHGSCRSAVRRHGRLAYSSMYYDLGDLRRRG